MSRTTKKEQQNSKWHIVNGQLWAWWYLCHISLPLWFSSHWVRVHLFYWIFCCPFNSFLWLQSSSGQNKNNNFSEFFIFVSIDFFSVAFFFHLNLIQFQWIFLNNLNNFPSFWWSALHRISNFRSIALKSIVEFYEPNIF